MDDPIFAVDTWESGGAIDEAALFAAGVSLMLVRINEITGGHNYDDNWPVQWAEAARFPYRVPFFIYSPFETGQANFEWLINNAPPNIPAMAVDVEVERTGYSPATYAAEFKKFFDLMRARWRSLIYTGEGFLPLLSSWPADADYWWAQYPNTLYPPDPIHMTWDTLRNRLQPYSGPFNANKVPGRLAMWQCSGDKLIMTGCEKPMDVNVWMGTMQQLEEFAGGSSTVPPAEPNPKLLFERQYYDGVIHRKMEITTLHGKAIYSLIQINNSKVDYFVSPYPSSRKYVPDYLDAFDIDLAINGDGWTSPPLVITGYAVSEGKPYGTQGQEETIWISPANLFSRTKPAAQWNAISYQNRLVLDGQVVPINKSPDDIRARSAWGYTKDQKTTYIIAVDGADYSVQQGLNFQEVAEILKNLGCDVGVMLDGGGSTTLAIRGPAGIEIINQPYGEDEVDRYPGYKLRRVANVLAVRARTAPIPPDPTDPPPGGTMDRYQLQNPARPRSIASMDTSDTTPNAPAGTEFDSDNAHVQRDIKNTAGPMMVQALSGQYTGKWFPIVHQGIEYARRISTGTTPPPAEDYINYHKADGSVVRYIPDPNQ